jgi:hypothetical protein
MHISRPEDDLRRLLLRQNLAKRCGLRGGGGKCLEMSAQGYQTPVQAMVDLVDAKSSPSMKVQPSSAGAEWVLMLQPSAMLRLEDLAQEELKLAGTRLLAQYDVPSRRTGYESVKLLHRPTLKEYEVQGLPPGRIFDAKWAPKGQRIGLTVLTADGLFLYTFTPEDRKASLVYDRRLSSAFASSYCWVDGGNAVLVNSVPLKRAAMPVRSKVPEAPLVQQCEAGNKAPARTYQDLLVDAHDEALFRYFCTTQVVHVHLGGQAPAINIGEPAMIVYYAPSPNAQYVLLEALQEPLSRVVLWNRFAKDVTVLNLAGSERHKTCLPLADSMPIGRDACRLGPRRHSWRPDEAATLTWVEALDGGDPKAVVAHRDVIYLQDLTDSASVPIELTRTRFRLSDVWWGGGSLDPWGGWPADGNSAGGDGRGDLALVRENDWKTRQSRVWQVLPGSAGGGPSLGFSKPLLKYRSEDRYNHPGSPMNVLTGAGTAVMRRDRAGRIMFAGTGGSDDGDRPFLDLRELFPRQSAYAPSDASEGSESEAVAPPSGQMGQDDGEGKTQEDDGMEVVKNTASVRLWRCDKGVYESIQNVVQVEPGKEGGGAGGTTAILLTTQETPATPPQVCVLCVAPYSGVPSILTAIFVCVCVCVCVCGCGRS